MQDPELWHSPGDTVVGLEVEVTASHGTWRRPDNHPSTAREGKKSADTDCGFGSCGGSGSAGLGRAVAPRRAEERRLGTLMAFLDPAHELALAAQKVKQKTGAYPKTQSAFSAFVDAQGRSLIVTIDAAMRSAGYETYSQAPGSGTAGPPAPSPPPALRGGGGDPSALFTFEGATYRLQILPGGRVGVTPGLAPASGSRPSWLKVMETDETPEGLTQ